MRLSFCSCAFRYQHKLRCDLRLFSCRFRTKGAPSWIGLDGRATSQCKIVSAMAMSTGTNPMQFQRTVKFVDRTNLFHRLDAANLVVGHLAAIFHSFAFVSGGGRIIRIYLYTIQEHLDRALERHGSKFTNDVRVVLGHGIPHKRWKH